MSYIGKTVSIIILSMLMLNSTSFSDSILSGSCDDQILALIAKCTTYIQHGSDPSKVSKECCNVIKNLDTKCVCSHVTKEVEKIVDMNKALFVMTKCGRPIAHGTQCGSFHVPMLY